MLTVRSRPGRSSSASPDVTRFGSAATQWYGRQAAPLRLPARCLAPLEAIGHIRWTRPLEGLSGTNPIQTLTTGKLAIFHRTGSSVRLPLALRIAAERATHHPSRSLRAFVDELADPNGRLDALATAVRAVFSWSYQTHPAETARMFRLLGLHPEPQVAVPAAAALIDHTLDGADQLLDKLAGVHLLEQPAPNRYRFHDLLRAYAIDVAERDEPAGARRRAQSRVLNWYPHTAAAAARILNPHRHHEILDQQDDHCAPLSLPRPTTH